MCSVQISACRPGAARSSLGRLIGRFSQFQPASTRGEREPAVACGEAPLPAASTARRAVARRAQQAARARAVHQPAQRQALRNRALAQCGEERVEPDPDAVDGSRFAPLRGEGSGTGGVMTQRADDMTSRGARSLEGRTRDTGAESSAHGFRKGPSTWRAAKRRGCPKNEHQPCQPQEGRSRQAERRGPAVRRRHGAPIERVGKSTCVQATREP